MILTFKHRLANSVVIKFIKHFFAEHREQKLGLKASALSYATLLAIVPMLAFMIKIADVFGYIDMFKNAIRGIYTTIMNL